MRQNKFLFPLIYTPLVTDGIMEFFITDRTGTIVASSKNETAAIIFVEIANQRNELPSVPNIELYLIE
jgi:hypothetical protein